ncbi:MAG: acetate--CoA ligase family protein [Acidimicrobiia bacterium]|nr:acetate--CoA ligase family protein [Acidimicrobiia bacterium]
MSRHLIERGLAPMSGIDEALAGLEAAAFFGVRFANPLSPIHPVPPFDDQARAALSEWDAKQILADGGVLVPDGLVTDRPGEVAADIGFPVALKIVGALHKSDTGGVMLYLESVEDVVAATGVMPPSDSYLVEQMIPGGVAELLVGVRRHDGLGWLLTIGAGGELTELANDTAHLLLPADAPFIRRALESLSVAALLNGYRGRPTIDLQFVVDAIDKICRVALEHERFDTVEVNPLVVTPEGAVAVDALIVSRHG